MLFRSQSAELLLDQLGANGAMAQRLARFPLPPRLSRILVEALDRGVGESGCHAAAMLGLGARSEKNDLLAAMDLSQDHRLRQHTEQLLRMARPPKQTRHDDDALLLSVLTGSPDRVARRRAGSQVLLSTGISAEVLGEPPPYQFMVALEVMLMGGVMMLGRLLVVLGGVGMVLGGGLGVFHDGVSLRARFY